jgi:hypothetical protein
MLAVGAVVALALTPDAAPAQPLLPWQHWVEKPIEDQTKSLEGLFDLPWRNSGGKEGELSIAEGQSPWGGRYFDFHVKIDHHNEGQYPLGWPSFEVQPKPPLDFSGYDALQYWIRCDTQRTGAVPIRFILWTDGAGRINEPIEPLKAREWVLRTQRLRDVPALDKVDRIHFFLCESDYNHADELTFRVGGFRLVNLMREPSKLAPDEAAMGLWVGDRADASERIVILDQGARSLPALLVVETGGNASLKPSDSLHVRFHEVFTGEATQRELPLAQAAPPGTVTRLSTELPLGDLAPGYYLVVADVQRDGKSLLGGRVGSDDLYIRKPDETMTYTVLSIRTGMVMWIRDQLYGDIIGWADAALPHCYDPLDEATYADFIRAYHATTWKHTEGNEAGDTGLALAAEAFRKSGDMTRCKFVEWLLDDSVDHMIGHMRSPSGAARTTTNEIANGGYQVDWGTNGYTYDSNQIGEWMRAITYAIIYYHQVPGRQERARELSAAVRKAADYLVAHATQDSDGLPRVIRHLALNEKPDGSVEQVTYHQEGRQCDVYLGRALSGLSYYAYAMQLLGEKVPDDWWPVLDNTVEWSARKMKPNGWFDWQCEDVVEGGCHTFLGNIYIGEGLFGCYLADKMAGRDEAAAKAAEATTKAYRYVTDDCYIKGVKYEYPLEFWVGPYVYWLFTEYLDTVGRDPAFEDWLKVLDERWSVEREWKDFLDRPRDGSGYVGRATANGMLNVALLGYLGIKQMDEIGKPLDWEAEPGSG